MGGERPTKGRGTKEDNMEEGTNTTAGGGTFVFLKFLPKLTTKGGKGCQLRETSKRAQAQVLPR